MLFTLDYVNEESKLSRKISDAIDDSCIEIAIKRVRKHNKSEAVVLKSDLGLIKEMLLGKIEKILEESNFSNG